MTRLQPQERDQHGRYAHQWGGVVAQDARGDIERCTGCGAYRVADGRGRWRAVREDTIDPRAFLDSDQTGASRYDLQPVTTKGGAR